MRSGEVMEHPTGAIDIAQIHTEYLDIVRKMRDECLKAHGSIVRPAVDQQRENTTLVSTDASRKVANRRGDVKRWLD